MLAYSRWSVIPQLMSDCRDGVAPAYSLDPPPVSIYVRTFAWALATMSSLGYGNAPVRDGERRVGEKREEGDGVGGENAGKSRRQEGRGGGWAGKAALFVSLPTG